MFRSRQGIVAAVLLLVLLAAGLLAAGLAAAGQAGPGTQGAVSFQKGGQIFLSKLAGVLGIEQSKLETAISEAQKQALDRMVTDGQITQTQADKMLQGMLKGPAGGFFPPAKGMFFKKDQRFTLKTNLEDVAKALEMNLEEFKAQLKAGKNLADIVKEKGITMEELQERLLDQAKAWFAEAVQAGKMTQEQADRIIDRLSKNKADLLRGFGNSFGLHPGKGPWGVKPNSRFNW